MRYPISLLVLTLIVISILTGKPSHSQDTSLDRLRIGYVLRDDYSINPLYNNYDYEREINELIFGFGLFRRTVQGAILPALAASFREESGTRWWITLRGDITFHDRSAVTSEDVKFSMDLYKKFALQSGNLFKARLINSVEIIDERNLVITLKRPLADFTQSIGLLPILPRKYYGQWIDYNYINSLPAVPPVGCGYFLIRRSVPGREIILSANQYYYSGKTQLSGISIYFYQAYDQMMDAFLNEQIDVIQVEDGQVFNKIRQFTGAVKDELCKRDIYNLFFINLNTKQAPFDDRNIRRAINYAINKNNIAAKDFLKQSRVVNNLLDESSRYAPPKITSYMYDPLTSQTMLENAGYRKRSNGKLFQNNQEFKFVLLFEEGSEFQESIVRLISINLAEIGVNAIPLPLSAIEIEEKISTGDYQAALQMDLTEPYSEEEVLRHFYLEELNRTNGFKNYKTQEMDRILIRLEEILADEIALPNWHRLQVVINRDSPSVFLFVQDHAMYFIHKRFMNTKSPFEENFGYKFKLNPKYEWRVSENQIR